MINNLFVKTEECLKVCEIEQKIKLSQELVEQFEQGRLSIDRDCELIGMSQPGMPNKLHFVSPNALPRRKFGTPEGKIAMLHAIAHIEFTAINIAWDAVYRFREMPDEYYSDWVRVAGEETTHFCMLRKQLQRLGHDYGDLPVHNGLWRAVENSAHDPLVRMAIVPKVHEARGLDVSPGLIKKFRECNENEIADDMQRIYEDEIGHVQTGNKWFGWLCQQKGVEPVETFIELLQTYKSLDKPVKVNREARLKAGFSNDELMRLEELS